MSIITPSIFTGEIAIPQTENYFMNAGNLQSFIDKYEAKFLKELFGVLFAKEFADGLAEDPIPDKWIELRDETDLKAMIADYVYYWWKRDETTQSLGISEAKPKAENASLTNSVDKQVRAWNEMVDMVRLFDLSTEVYPNFVRRHWRRYRGSLYGNYYCEQLPPIYEYINSLNF